MGLSINVPGLLQLLAIGLAVCVVAAVWYTMLTLRRPPRRGYAFAVSRGIPGDPSEVSASDGRGVRFAEWTLRSRGMDLPVWDVEGRDGLGATVIVSHGWGESRVMALSRLDALLGVSRRVLLWDLPGHGAAPGRCGLGAQEHRDLLALIGNVRAQRDADGVETGPLVLYGSSLGAGVSIVAAAEDGNIDLVIAEAPYRVPIVPARNVLRQAGLPYRVPLPVAMALLGLRLAGTASWSVGGDAGGFDRVLHARRLRCPLVVIHGDRDTVCPVEDGEAIAAAAERGRMERIEDAGHLDLWTKPEFRGACARVVELAIGEAVRAHGGDPREAAHSGAAGQR